MHYILLYIMHYLDDEITIYENHYMNINKIIDGKKLQEISIKDINIGDKVYITFISDSQKYIYTLYPKLGIVVDVDIQKDISEQITIKMYNDDVESLLHCGVSFMGQSLGYCYIIYKIIN
jgi:hypothetical protein